MLMKTMIELRLWIRKGYLAKVFEYFHQCEIEVSNMKMLKSSLHKELFLFDIIYANSEKFEEFTNDSKAWYKIDAINNPFLDVIRGGLLTINGKAPIENINDFQTKIIGAYELINHKISEGKGHEFSGVAKNVGIICGIDCSVDVSEQYKYSLNAIAEIEAIIINKLIGYNAYPLIVEYNYLR